MKKFSAIQTMALLAVLFTAFNVRAQEISRQAAIESSTQSFKTESFAVKYQVRSNLADPLAFVNLSIDEQNKKTAAGQEETDPNIVKNDVIRVAVNDGFTILDVEVERRITNHLNFGVSLYTDFGDMLRNYLYLSAFAPFSLDGQPEGKRIVPWFNGGFDYSLADNGGSSGFIYEAGADLFLSSGFGVTAYTPEFKGLFFGLVFKI